MRGTYWLQLDGAWSKHATVDAALEHVVDIRGQARWSVFVHYGTGQPQLVRWGVGPTR